MFLAQNHHDGIEPHKPFDAAQLLDAVTPHSTENQGSLTNGVSPPG